MFNIWASIPIYTVHLQMWIFQPVMLVLFKPQVPLENTPVAVVLSRQALPTLDRTEVASAKGLQQGGRGESNEKPG